MCSIASSQNSCRRLLEEFLRLCSRPFQTASIHAFPKKDLFRYIPISMRVIRLAFRSEVPRAATNPRVFHAHEQNTCKECPDMTNKMPKKLNISLLWKCNTNDGGNIPYYRAYVRGKHTTAAIISLQCIINCFRH